MKRNGDPVWWRRLLSSWVGLAFLAALFLAGVGLSDTYIMHQVIVFKGSPRLATMAYLVLGSWVILVATVLNARFLGKILYPEYKGIRLGGAKIQAWALVTGLLSAIATCFGLVANQNCDPSLVIALSNLPIFYLVLFDCIFKGESWRALLLPGVLVVVGSCLTSFTNLSGLFVAGSSLIGVLALIFVRAPLSAAAKSAQTEGTKGIDPINFTLWRFVWLTIWANVSVFAIAWWYGELRSFVNFLSTVAFQALPFIALTALFASLANVLEISAQKIANSASRVAMIMTAQVWLAVPLTVLFEKILPGSFGELPTSPIVWILRFVGGILIAFGCYRLTTKRRLI